MKLDKDIIIDIMGLLLQQYSKQVIDSTQLDSFFDQIKDRAIGIPCLKVLDIKHIKNDSFKIQLTKKVSVYDTFVFQDHSCCIFYITKRLSPNNSGEITRLSQTKGEFWYEATIIPKIQQTDVDVKKIINTLNTENMYIYINGFVTQ